MIHLLEVRKDILEKWKSYLTPLEQKLPKDSSYRDHYLQQQQNRSIRNAMMELATADANMMKDIGEKLQKL